MATVYKLMGESHDMREDETVYASSELALIAAKEWEGFLGMTVEEALSEGEIWLKEWELIE